MDNFRKRCIPLSRRVFQHLDPENAMDDVVFGYALADHLIKREIFSTPKMVKTSIDTLQAGPFWVGKKDRVSFTHLILLTFCRILYFISKPKKSD